MDWNSCMASSVGVYGVLGRIWPRRA
uniref:Uncharacterized protein n=1 Tax=Zea mays TaxID=4577 RepID=C4J1D7_MAIZE|nr:unknown [Zea mays]